MSFLCFWLTNWMSKVSCFCLIAMPRNNIETAFQNLKANKGLLNQQKEIGDKDECFTENSD